MKKFLTIAVVLALLALLFTSCNASQDPMEKYFSTVVSKMNRELEKRIRLFETTMPDYIYSEEFELISNVDFSEPCAIFKISLSEEEVTSAMERMSEEEKEKQPKDLHQFAYAQLIKCFNEDVNSVAYHTVTDKTFKDKEIKEPAFFLQLYEDKHAILFGVMPDGAGKVTVWGTFVYNKDFDTNNMETMEEIIVNEVSLPGTVVEKSESNAH